MKIELPSELVERLHQRGEDEATVVRHALDTLDWLDREHPTQEELAATLRELDRSVAEVQDGRLLSLQEAKACVQNSLGLSSGP